MRLRGVRGSKNIEDRRGSGGGKRRAAGGIGGVGLLVVLAVGYFTGVDVAPLLEGTQAPQTQSRQTTAQDDRAGQFTSSVLATTEQVGTRFSASN
jgi:predicted metalloprotease